MSEPAASIVMPTYNKAARLRLALASLITLELEASIQIIVVNDGSTDRTDEIITEFHEQVSDHPFIHFQPVHITNQGRAAARNIGTSKAVADIIIFTDDDLLLHPMFVKEHLRMHDLGNYAVHGTIYNLPYLKFFADPESGELVNTVQKTNQGRGLRRFLVSWKDIISGNLAQIEYGKRLSKFEKDIQELFRTSHDRCDRGRWVCTTGGNLSLSKKMFDRVGGFDTSFGTRWGCEDLELGYRLMKDGASFAFGESAVNYHMSHFRENTEELHRQSFQLFYDKHCDEQILRLLDYFEHRIPSLVAWEQLCTAREAQ